MLKLTYYGSLSITGAADTQVNAPRLNPSQTDRYSIYLRTVSAKKWKAELTMAVWVEIRSNVTWPMFRRLC